MNLKEFTLFVTEADASKAIEDSTERAGAFYGEAEATLQERTASDDQTMVLDLSALPDSFAFSSSFIGRLVSLYKQLKVRCPKGVVRLTEVPDNVCEQLQITNLTKIFEVFNRKGERVAGKNNETNGAAGVSADVSSASRTL